MSVFLQNKKRVIAYIMMLLMFVSVALFAPYEEYTYGEEAEAGYAEEGAVESAGAIEEAGEEEAAYEGAQYGFWAPAVMVVMFIFVLLTKNLLEGFIVNAFLVVFIRYRWAVIPAFVGDFTETLTDFDTVRLILIYLLIGSVIAVVSKSGGARALADWIKSKAKSPKLSLVLAWVIDVLLSIDDELSAFTAGTAITPIADSYKVPREKTSFIIRSSAVAPATLWPLGAWAVFVAVVFEMNGLAPSGEGMGVYMKIIPFLFFPMIILIVSLLTALGVIPDFGKMKKATRRVQAGGPVAPIPAERRHDEAAEADEAIPQDDFKPRCKPRAINFAVPMIALVGGSIISGMDILTGIVICLVVTFFLYIIEGVCTVDEFIETMLLGGMKDMLELTAIFAVSILFVNEMGALGLAGFIVDLTKNLVIPSLLPMMIFLIFMCTEFIGSMNWTLYMIATPILIPLCNVTGANLFLTLAAMVSAGAWGSQACFFSDGALVASAATKIDVYEHSTTAIQYTLGAGILTAVCYLVAGLLLT